MGAEAKLAQCPRCKAPTLVAERQGYRIAIDIAPVDALGYGNAVAGGVGLWWAQNEPGQPSRVLGPRSAATNPSWGPGGSQTGSQRLHAEHSCGASARDQVILNVQRPLSAPVTPGSPRGGLHRPDAPAGATAGQERPSRAQPATPHLSDHGGPRPPTRPTRCGICDQMIREGQSWWGFEHSTTVYAEHEECP